MPESFEEQQRKLGEANTHAPMGGVAKDRKKIVVVEEMFGEKIEREYIESMHPVDKETWDAMTDEERVGKALYAPFNQRVYEIEGEIICEQDVGIPMRDGVTIYADFYKPKNYLGKLPTIVSWSMYGKRPNEYNGDRFKIMGVQPGTVSKDSKFESPDPGYWCRKGYCVANVDPRGVGHSEGNVELFNSADGKDGYDFIEWVAAQDWSNGRVGLGGNSAVAMTQWRIAAEQPPHLACIAPWEGTGDQYRESLMEGGIPGLTFPTHAIGMTVGPNFTDNMPGMALKYPLYNGYWKDKTAQYEKIKCPVYTTVCWNHFHLRGSMLGFRRVRSQKKWIRCHQEFEWPDTYCVEGIKELELFYERYLKGVHNGWEMTPRVRIEVMDAYNFIYQKNRPEEAFPLKRTVYEKLYLNAKDLTMAKDQPAKEAETSYDGNTGLVEFDYQFQEDTELTGYMKLRLWVEARGHDDMDLFINVKKADKDGNEVPVYILGENAHPGAWGKMRVSHRKLDEKQSTEFQPIQAHDEIQKLSPGEIVPVDIEINPLSRFWHKGEKIRVQVAGRYVRNEWFEPLMWETDNHGDHVIHTGGKYDSFLQIPVIPPKYQVGDYIVR